MRRFELPEGWVVQAFDYVLDTTAEQDQILARQFGGRRYAHNWAVRTLKADIVAFHSGHANPQSKPPSFYGLRKRWNQAKASECVDKDSGQAWWPQVSKDAFADGIRGAVDGYWRWQKSRAGKFKGPSVGFPRLKKKGKDRDRFTVTTGPMRVEPDRRHVTLPKVGKVRTWENTRGLERLIASGRARVLAVTVRRRGGRVHARFRVAVSRRATRPAQPDSTVGVDVGVRRLATVARPDGTILAVVDNPKPLETNLGHLRRLCRQRSRRQRGSTRYKQTSSKIGVLLTHIADVRSDAINKLTTDLAKTHGRVVVERLNVAGMLGQKGLPGARARRRRLADAALGQIRTKLRYKQAWYGSELIEADRFYPSSQICSSCGSQAAIGWAETWDCGVCGAHHHRDDNAAINLARYPAQGWPAVGPVGSPVKRRADLKTRPRLAGGDEARNPTPGGVPHE